MAKPCKLKNANADCFAKSKADTCLTTLNKSCSGCRFFKTKRQLDAERYQSEKRIEEMYDIRYSQFMQDKGYAK